MWCLFMHSPFFVFEIPNPCGFVVLSESQRNNKLIAKDTGSMIKSSSWLEGNVLELPFLSVKVEVPQLIKHGFVGVESAVQYQQVGVFVCVEVVMNRCSNSWKWLRTVCISYGTPSKIFEVECRDLVGQNSLRSIILN